MAVSLGLLASTGSVVGRGGGLGSQCFQLTYQSLEGYTNLLGRKIEKHIAVADYHLHSCMFSTSSKQFIGRFHDSMSCGLVESLQSGAVICPIQQTAFFYSPHPDPSLILVTELTAAFLSGSVEMCVVLGWGMLPVFDHHGRSTVGGVADTVRLPLYEGSPRALFSLQHPSSDSKDLVPIPGCILTCSLCPHPTLGKATHLFPGNVLVSYDDIIPGLTPTRVHEAFPKLVRVASASLEKVSLLLLPSVNDFEEQLLSLLTEDIPTEDSDSAANSIITIEERRLKIMLYNGWQFTSSSIIGYLEKVSPSTSLRGSFRSSGYGPRNNLILRGSLEIVDIIAHPLTEVVLQLEYVVSWSGVAMATKGQEGRRRGGSITAKPSSTHSIPLVLGWGVWQPCDSEGSLLEEEGQVSVDLKAGPGFRPTVIPHSAWKACYEGNLKDAGKVAFKFVPSRASSRLEGSQVLASSASNVQFEDFTPRRPPGVTEKPTGRDMPDTGEVTEPVQRAVEEPPMVPHTPVTSTPIKKQVVADEGGSSSELVPSDHPPPPILEIRPAGEPVVTATHTRGVHPVSRSTLAFLHSSGFEEFRDDKGAPLPSIDPTAATVGVEGSQTGSMLEAGPYQIALQLMAFSLSKTHPSAAGRVPQSLLLSSQFSLFPPVSTRCQLVRTGEGRALPLILQPEGGGESKAGVVHWYPITAQTLPSRTDRTDFSSHLLSGSLLVDIYDGESLILLGTAAVPIKGLLHQEKSYFQITLSCFATFAESTADSSITNVSVDPLGNTSSSHTVGKLYLRLAKLPPDNRDIPQPQSPSKKPCRQARFARRLYGYASEEGAAVRREDERTRKRKQARMQSVREMQRSDTDASQAYTLPTLPVSSQLNIIDIQREELKRESIASVLEESITSTYLIRPRMGRLVYFEHQFSNMHNHPLTITISWKDPNLRMVTDRNECHFLRQIHSIYTAIDDNLITESPESGHYGFFVHPSETVRIPFKYQSFSPVLTAGNGGERVAARIIKVYFQGSQRELLAILNVQVEPQPQRVDRVFHFYHPQRTFLKKLFLLPATSPLGQQAGSAFDFSLDSPELFACSSDPDNHCEIRKSGGSRSVFIKAPVGPSPSTQAFFIMLYRQRYLVSPDEVWQVHVHSVHRCDHSLVVGQSSALKLTLRGSHSNRRMACFSSTGPVMKVATPSPFLLAANTLSEMNFSLKTLTIGNSHCLITAVDVDSRELVDAWLVNTTGQEPSISRAFQISLSARGSAPVQKTITFTNPYSKPKRFSLSSDHPNTIKFSSNTLKLQPHETAVVGLQFAPSPQPLSTIILVFINDDQDQTEECFLVKTIYS